MSMKLKSDLSPSPISAKILCPNFWVLQKMLGLLYSWKIFQNRFPVPDLSFEIGYSKPNMRLFLKMNDSNNRIVPIMKECKMLDFWANESSLRSPEIRSGQTNGQKNEWPIFMANGHLAIHYYQDFISDEWSWPFTWNRIWFWRMASHYKIRIFWYKEI